MKHRKFIASFDLHGDMADQSVVKKLHEFTKVFKPDLKIFGGDLFDFRCLRKKAGNAEKAESIADDVAMGMEFLKEWRPNVYLRGNHCERLWDLADNNVEDGLKRDAAQNGVNEIEDLCKKQGTIIYPYDKRKGIHREGRLLFLHGYAHGAMAIRKSLQSYGENIVMGHCHTIQQATVEGLTPRQGWIAGCLCRLDYEYNRATISALAQENGFVYGLLLNNGGFIVHQARKVSGDWIVSTDFKII